MPRCGRPQGRPYGGLDDILPGGTAANVLKWCGQNPRPHPTQNWCIDNWGTRGNAEEPNTYCDGERGQISFDTAWSPSLEVTKALSLLYPTLTFKYNYEEGGNDFSGNMTFRNGVILEENGGDYNDYPVSEHLSEDEEDSSEEQS